VGKDTLLSAEVVDSCQPAINCCIKMKEFGFATIAASGLAAAVIGLAGPANADIVHHDWVHDIQQQVTVPQVDTSVQQSR
jgi:hypothetical protein